MKQFPLAPRKASVKSVHGIPLIDNYAWLQDKENPEVIAYLKAENAYSEEMMQDQQALEKQLYEEMKQRIKPDDQSAPVRIDDYYYYSRTEAHKNYRIYCRKFGSLQAPEEILLDCNHLAEGHDYFHLGAFEVSPDHTILAYAIDTDGSEQYWMFFKNLQDHTLMVDQIRNMTNSAAWAMDGETIFYVVQNETMRPYKVLRHRLGTRPEDDVEVFHEADERFFVSVSLSKNRAFLLIDIGSKITSEVRILSAHQPEGDFSVFAHRKDQIEYTLYPHQDCFYILTNWKASNFRLMKAPLEAKDNSLWKEVIPHDPKVKIEGVDEFENHLAIYERANGMSQIKIFALQDTLNSHLILYDEPAYYVFGGNNPTFHTDVLRFHYTSLLKPNTVYAYHMPSREKQVIKETEIPGGYDDQAYTSERIEALSEDGTVVPISLVYRKDIAPKGINPLLLYGYGAYGLNAEPYFNENRISLLDRGFIFAIAHIRGGADLGEDWHKAGKLLKKKNSFTDFICCAEHLIKEKYTDQEHLCAIGGSAGGLLMGAVINLRPDLFEAIIAKVPFVDVLNTMLDPNLPLTITEYEEWGNPEEKAYFEYIHSYSPYDNIKPQSYPHLLITAGLNDPRVSYWEPAKWAAKLRALKTDNHLLLLKTNMDAGHGGASGRYEYLKEIAFEYAFLIKVLGIARDSFTYT
ncbi:S9 family peptidase [Catalinimonas niigatensis]|uniref:S9 family peptidase n=1 Tax=Catalinimonas niigatensis TaxID=1397264 RepID=UPI00266654B2|nr:S9 family peptidase [Catalinimonas niigatensis]WPP51267.1 S9 family peptidase [Catalinimonas niigatensis]